MEEVKQEAGPEEESPQAVPLERALEVVQQSMFEIAANRMSQFESMTKYALKVTNPQDWMNYGGHPGLNGPGSERIARVFGLKFFNMLREPRKEAENDGSYSYVVTGDVGFSELETLPILGSCNSRKPFFAKAQGEEVPQSEIDPNNIKKNALTNFYVNAVSRFLGLRGLTWEDLERISAGKITQGGSRTVDFKSGSADQDETAKGELEVVWKRLLEMNAQGVADAKRQLKELTAFTGKDGKAFRGYTDHTKVSPAVLKRLGPKVEKLHKEWVKGGGTDTPPPETTPSDPPQASNGSSLVEKAQKHIGELAALNPAYGMEWAITQMGEMGYEDLNQLSTNKTEMSGFLNKLLSKKAELTKAQQDPSTP